MQNARCPNANHSRTNAPVRVCPMCGDVVNGNVPMQKCREDEHAKSRREQSRYCVDCGEQLIKDI